jgi:hypothetical protein
MFAGVDEAQVRGCGEGCAEREEGAQGGDGGCGGDG